MTQISLSDFATPEKLIVWKLVYFNTYDESRYASPLAVHNHVTSSLSTLYKPSDSCKIGVNKIRLENKLSQGCFQISDCCLTFPRTPQIRIGDVLLRNITECEKCIQRLLLTLSFLSYCSVILNMSAAGIKLLVALPSGDNVAFVLFQQIISRLRRKETQGERSGTNKMQLI